MVIFGFKRSGFGYLQPNNAAGLCVKLMRENLCIKNLNPIALPPDMEYNKQAGFRIH